MCDSTVQVQLSLTVTKNHVKLKLLFYLVFIAPILYRGIVFGDIPIFLCLYVTYCHNRHTVTIYKSNVCCLLSMSVVSVVTDMSVVSVVSVVTVKI